ncbi:hypothetical protein D3C71_1731700 [compost metagenome]
MLLGIQAHWRSRNLYHPYQIDFFPLVDRFQIERVLKDIGVNLSVRYSHIRLDTIGELFICNFITFLLQIRSNALFELIAIRSWVEADPQRFGLLFPVCGIRGTRVGIGTAA